VNRKNYSKEFREIAVHRVIDESRPIVDVAKEIGVHEGTLSNWIRLYREQNLVADSPLSGSERARLKELERENRELRMKTEFLGKAATDGAPVSWTVGFVRFRVGVVVARLGGIRLGFGGRGWFGGVGGCRTLL
jgi:transposase